MALNIENYTKNNHQLSEQYSKDHLIYEIHGSDFVKRLLYIF